MGSDAIPRQVRIVGIVLIAGGGMLFLRSLVRVHPHWVGILLAALDIALGIGLLKLKPVARLLTLVWLGIIMALATLIVMTALLSQTPLVRAPRVPLVIMCAFLFAASAVGYRMLTKPQVLAAFTPQK